MTADDRRCPGCGDLVTNENLDGHSGKGALSGELHCTKCADRADAEDYCTYRREKRKAAELKVTQAVRAEIEAILAEFVHIDRLLVKSRAALTLLRCDPGVLGVQRSLLLLSREYARDVEVMIHSFQQRHW
jgi:hypothetical protein